MTARRTAAAILVALVVAGVLGMHTLGLHGTAHGGHGAAAVHSVTEAHPVTDHEHESLGSDPGGPADPIASACLFLLVAGALAMLLAPLVRRRPRGGLPLERPGPGVRTVRSLVDGCRPPPVWEHSVVRC